MTDEHFHSTLLIEVDQLKLETDNAVARIWPSAITILMIQFGVEKRKQGYRRSCTEDRNSNTHELCLI